MHTRMHTRIHIRTHIRIDARTNVPIVVRRWGSGVPVVDVINESLRNMDQYRPEVPEANVNKRTNDYSIYINIFVYASYTYIKLHISNSKLYTE